MSGDWLPTDEAEDVAGSVRHALRCASLVEEDPHAWKWFALAVHSALQGACVAHLTTTAAPVGAVTERNAGEWLDYFARSRTDPDARPPRTSVMNLPDLLKAIRRPHSAGDRSNPEGIALSDGEMAWLRRFHNDIRNQFVHFAPRGWSIETSGLPGLAALAARVIGDIAAAGWAFRHASPAWRERMRADLAALGALAAEPA